MGYKPNTVLSRLQQLQHHNHGAPGLPLAHRPSDADPTTTTTRTTTARAVWAPVPGTTATRTAPRPAWVPEPGRIGFGGSRAALISAPGSMRRVCRSVSPGWGNTFDFGSLARAALTSVPGRLRHGRGSWFRPVGATGRCSGGLGPRNRYRMDANRGQFCVARVRRVREAFIIRIGPAFQDPAGWVTGVRQAMIITRSKGYVRPRGHRCPQEATDQRLILLLVRKLLALLRRQVGRERRGDGTTFVLAELEGEGLEVGRLSVIRQRRFKADFTFSTSRTSGPATSMSSTYRRRYTLREEPGGLLEAVEAAADAEGVVAGRQDPARADGLSPGREEGFLPCSGAAVVVELGLLGPPPLFGLRGCHRLLKPLDEAEAAS
ncbi:hypothetical protein OC861_006948, partial [Tilletia horrida]